MKPNFKVMHITLVNQFYPPDLAPTGRYLRDLAEGLAARGHQVSVVSSRLSYSSKAAPERISTHGQVQEIRVGASGQEAVSLVGKAIGYAKFMCQAWWALFAMRPKPDVVVTLTTPPWIGWVASLAVGRRCRRVHWIMDLYPQVLVAHNLVREGSLQHRVLAWMTRWEWRRSDLIITLGSAMTQWVKQEEACVADSKIETIPLWSLDALLPWPDGQVNLLREERRWPRDQTILMYTGNMGYGHEIGVFLEMMQKLGSDHSLRLVFAGWGIRQVEVERFIQAHPELPVELLSPASPERLREHLCSADVQLVSIRSGWAGLIVPSKFQAAFAVGKPVLYVGPANSETAKWICESGGGWVVDESDREGLVKAFRECGDSAERERRGRAGHLYAERYFNRENNIRRICERIEALGLVKGEGVGS